MAGGQNLGALTTTAPLSSSCVDELDVVYKVHTTPEGYYYLLNGPLEPASCYPSGYAGITTQYYSPAPACPSGFTSACGTVNAIGTVSETAYTCCPTEYDYTCQTNASYAWESTLGCVYPVDSSSSTAWTVVKISSGLTSTITSTGYAGGMNAYSIQVRFQASDLTTATSTSSQTTPTTAAVTGTNNDSPSSTSEASSSSNGLSTGAIAGIAVGVGLVGLAIIGAVAFLMIKKRKQKRVLQPTQVSPTQELDNNKSTPAYQYYYSELDTGRPNEVHEAPA
ncbi:hypothetical protein PFICI_05426 [Pestalotiopsis fici W106-1]|uniref:Mid2 domain-containing protein n=1 Tax=Pestalotiopsis fici (strain W106-1 / CGMCC3.15140) TaxID=1229662 RepID=W3XBX5_PESFW|nr:uncharacterized protein PFICI_05426 [Pestalotiopsis fici W106-1]ETS83550.1 hypothetical protein PFICI_05426 [Pestalotiopsis fici W106-1]